MPEFGMSARRGCLSVSLPEAEDADRGVGPNIYLRLGPGGWGVVHAPPSAVDLRRLHFANIVTGHGTGTVAGDPIEAEAIASVFGELSRHPRPQFAKAGPVRSDHGTGVAPIIIVDLGEGELEARKGRGEGRGEIHVC